MKSEYITLFTVIASVLSGWGGAFIAGHYSRKASTDAINKERSIEAEKEAQKEKRELIKLYTYLIKLDYGEEITSFQPNGLAQIDDEMYESYVRDSIYGKYHLIHESVIKRFEEVEKINKKLKNEMFYSNHNEMTLDLNDAAESYMSMINEIKTILDKERMNY